MSMTSESLSTDLISRAALFNSLANVKTLEEAFAVIQNAPAVDAVEVVRCNDCKYYVQDIMANPWGVCCHEDWVVGLVGNEVMEDGWCYRAKGVIDE